MASIDSKQVSGLSPAPSISPQPEAPLSVDFFFIHPAPWMREEVFPALIHAEIPVREVIHFHLLPRICRKFPGSIFFLNADHSTAGDQTQWPRTIANIATILIETHSTIIFLSRGLNATRQSELRNTGVAINFIEMNQASKILTKQIYTLIQTFSQKSRRRTIRVSCSEKAKAIYNFQADNQQIRGLVSDISSAGLAAILPDPYPFSIQEGYELNNLQLKLKSSLVLVNAQVAAVRKSQGQHILIAQFRWGDDKRGKDRIHQFIGACLQESLDQLLH